MAKFDAATAVEEMEYDFSKYGGSEGIIPEPTTGQMNDFVVGMRRLMTEYRSLMPERSRDQDTEDMTTEDMADMLEQMNEDMATAQEFNTKTVALTAEFCSNSPGVDELSKLPLRVMRAFSKWLMQQINPKEEEEQAAPTTRPTPQDRRPATKRSQKGKR